jgi:hypothetical protein
VLRLSQLVMGSAGDQDAKDEQDDSDALYARCAQQVSCVITTGSALKMVGYYLRAVLVDGVKRRHRQASLSILGSWHARRCLRCQNSAHSRSRRRLGLLEPVRD